MATADLTGRQSPADEATFTGGHATEWTQISFDRWVRKIGVNNRGAGSLWVSRNLVGTRAAADDQVEVKPGTTVDFQVQGRARKRGAPTLSVWGADGATHAMGFVLEEH